MKKIILCTSVIILFAAGIAYYLFGIDWDSQPFVLPKGTVPLRISPETTVVTEPLLPGGHAVDFFAVLDQKCSAGADAEDNGFREIIRLVGRSICGSISDEKWNILCKKLNLNPDDPPQFHYVPLIDFLCDALEQAEGKMSRYAEGKRVFDNAMYSQAWNIEWSLSQDDVPAENLELLERWATEMEPAISAVAEALK